MLFRIVLQKNGSLPIATLNLEDKSGATTRVQFNPGRRDLLASCDCKGRILIWKLATNLIS